MEKVKNKRMKEERKKRKKGMSEGKGERRF